MALELSFSTDRRMRRCPRQLFFSDVAASHNARDPLRRECFVLSQLKSLEAWRGLVVHQAIESFVVPCWQNGQPVPWSDLIGQARALAWRQFEFSAARKYREPGMSKKKAQGHYLALYAHEFDMPVAAEQLAATLDSIEKALYNLSQLHTFLKQVEGRRYYRSELALSTEYNGVRIKGQVDLLFGRNYGQYGVVDWKDYETPSASDARLQMSLYAWLLCRNQMWRVSGLRDIELWEVKLAEGNALCHTIGESSFHELEDFLYRSTEQLRALCGDGQYDPNNLETFPYTENPNSCRFCPYGNVCREPEKWITIASTSMKSKKQDDWLLRTA